MGDDRETYIEERRIEIEEKKNIYDIDYGTLFKMKNSQKTFLVIRKYYTDYERLFVDLETGLAFSRSDLLCFGYCFYHDNDENIDKVKIIGHI